MLYPWVGGQLAMVEDIAVVLFGVETAWAVLGTDVSNIDELRKQRFIHESFPETNFFVTYSADQVMRAPGDVIGEVGRGWEDDLWAIFTARSDYFTYRLLKA